MDEEQKTKISKYLSYVLRHNPADAELSLHDGGWVEVNRLVVGVQRKFPEFDETLLRDLVDTDAKSRYAIEKGMIRAQQGHSIGVGEVGLDATPPDSLFHGTTEKSWAEIQAHGAIRPMGRNHVHLSADVETAMTVASRRKNAKNVVLEINSKEMSARGYPFAKSGNGVWLIDCVPIEFVENLGSKPRLVE